jgi:hypothetical protein
LQKLLIQRRLQSTALQTGDLLQQYVVGTSALRLSQVLLSLGVLLLLVQVQVQAWVQTQNWRPR